jgi:hypothetical protein
VNIREKYMGVHYIHLSQPVSSNFSNNKLEEDAHTKTCPWMFIMHNSQKLKRIKMSINWWMDKQNAVLSKKWTTTQQYKETYILWVPTTTQMNLRNILFSERIHSKRLCCIMIPLTQNIRKMKINRNREQISGNREWGFG